MSYESLADHPAESATHRRYLLAGTALVVSLVAYVTQTLAASEIARLEYRKPFFLLYLTHSSWVLLAPLQVLVLYLRRAHAQSFTFFFQKHRAHLLHTAQQICFSNSKKPVAKYFILVAHALGLALNIAGASWYVAVNMTTAADLTAIYNCSAFFAYVFSIPILKESWDPLKGASVLLSIVGVALLAYGGSAHPAQAAAKSRSMGNLIIACGAVLYGLYDVLYKRIACAPQTVTAKKQAAFAVVVASMIGTVNLLILWPFLVVFHYTGIETFELPHGRVLLLALISVFSNMIFSGSFLVLMALTSPVFGAVSSLLTTFIVPIVEFMLFGRRLGFYGFMGGLLVILAFLVLCHASWRDLEEPDVPDHDEL